MLAYFFQSRKVFNILIGMFVLSCYSLILSNAYATQVSLAWKASTSTVAGYRVYYGPNSGNYTSVEPSGSTLITGTQYTTGNLSAGEYYFAVKAVDSAGTESSPSNEAHTTIAAAISAPVAGFSCSPTSGVAPVTASFRHLKKHGWDL